MSNEQPGQRISFKCTYCGSPITVTYSQFRFTEICPSCRGSVMIPRSQPGDPSMASPLATPVVKESGEWPAAHYAQPGARVIDIPPPSPTSKPATEAVAPVPAAAAPAAPTTKASSTGPDDSTLIKSVTDADRKRPTPIPPNPPESSQPSTETKPPASDARANGTTSDFTRSRPSGIFPVPKPKEGGIHDPRRLENRPHKGGPDHSGPPPRSPPGARADAHQHGSAGDAG